MVRPSTGEIDRLVALPGHDIDSIRCPKFLFGTKCYYTGMTGMSPPPLEAVLKLSLAGGFD
jgi:hypothetical protein